MTEYAREDEEIEIRFTAPHAIDCPYCGARPNLEHEHGKGFRFMCPHGCRNPLEWNRTLSGAALEWNAQEARGRIVYRGRDA